MTCRRLHAADLLDSRTAAARVGVTPSSWRSYLARGIAPPPVVYVGGAPAWTAAALDAWVAQRPGRGVGGGRPRRESG